MFTERQQALGPWMRNVEVVLFVLDLVQGISVQTHLCECYEQSRVASDRLPTGLRDRATGLGLKWYYSSPPLKHVQCIHMTKQNLIWDQCPSSFPRSPFPTVKNKCHSPRTPANIWLLSLARKVTI